jgi:aminoglycoside phosphotransferase (APT) family kinase protein
MAAPIQRDEALTRQSLTRWLCAQLPQAAIEITGYIVPAAGNSSETLLVDVQVTEKSYRRLEKWVVRIQASSFQVYQDPSVAKQFRVMDALSRYTAVPIPRPRWLELDPAPLGAPFFVMDRVEGQVPTRHHGCAWLVQATPTRRERLWLSAMEALALLHKTDAALVGFLNRPALGPTGLDQEIATWNTFLEWSHIPAHPTLERGQRWLEDHAPVHRPTGLSWGDAQLGNMIFHGSRCVALLDWETVSLAGAEADLAWWLTVDHFYSASMGIARLPGLGDRDATISAWQHFAGRKAHDMEWHEMFAAFRLSAITERAIALSAAAGQPLPGIGPGDANPFLRHLEHLLVGGS